MTLSTLPKLSTTMSASLTAFSFYSLERVALSTVGGLTFVGG